MHWSSTRSRVGQGIVRGPGASSAAAATAARKPIETNSGPPFVLMSTISKHLPGQVSRKACEHRCDPKETIPDRVGSFVDVGVFRDLEDEAHRNTLIDKGTRTEIPIDRLAPHRHGFDM